MNKKFWIKLYLEILDDPKMGRLPDHLWKFAVELFLLAGREGNDGSLPPLAEMAWTLRVPEEKVLEDIRSLVEVGVVHACATHPGTGEEKEGVWCVTHFQERQKCESYERVKRYRERYKDNFDNGEVAEVSSTSTSPSKSISFSDSEEEVGVHAQKTGAGEKPLSELENSEIGQQKSAEPVTPRALPSSPAEAMVHPDVRVYTVATGGRIPGLSQYKTVIDTVRFLRRREKLDDQALVVLLKPYWLAWTSRKRANGLPYDPGNITWLVEWALNGFIPANHSASNGSGQNPEKSMQDKAEVIRRVAKGKP